MQKQLWILLIIALAMAGCKNDIDRFTPDPFDPPGPDPQQITFTASTFVEVVDIDGTPLEDVTISLNGETAATDELGVAYLKDVTMNASTYLTADKAGFFHGSRRFYPAEGKDHFVKIMLMPAVVTGTIQSGQGGEISVTGGTRIHLPAGSIVHQDGSEYSGSVDVLAQSIAADDPDLSYKMPGDLVGETVDGAARSLASAGMAVVELRSENGDLLQIKPGAQVVLEMDIPAEMAGNTPAAIPMWYFDEVEGIWKEEGTASLQGGTYVANVGHFTYWNYDAWFPIVKWGASFVYENGDPASQVSVCITILSMQATKCAYTNSEGQVCGMVAEDELLLMEVKDPCGNVVYSEQIGPYSDTTMIGPITIPSTSVSTVEITGSAVNCEGDPVTNGFAVINSGANHFVSLEVDGSFSTTIMNCLEEDVMITVYDEDAAKQSLPQSFDYAPMIDAGTITVCENLTEYINLEVESVVDPYVFFLPSATVVQSLTRIISTDSTGQSQFFFVSFVGTTAGTYTDVSAEIGLEHPTGTMIHAEDVDIVVTYFGDVGDFIQGTITGTMVESGGATQYDLTGTFSVLRE